jgi:hypothetical protein
MLSRRRQIIYSGIGKRNRTNWNRNASSKFRYIIPSKYQIQNLLPPPPPRNVVWSILMSLGTSLVVTWVSEVYKFRRSHIQEITFHWPVIIPHGLCGLHTPVPFNLRIHDLGSRICQILTGNSEPVYNLLVPLF